MKPAQLCIAAIVLGVFAVLVACGVWIVAPADATRRADAATIEIRVVDRATQKPVAGATVVALPHGKPPVETTTDAAGSARFPVVARDEGWRVRVRADGYETRDLGLGDADAFTIELGPGATAQGVVLEQDGRPLAGAHVFFYRAGDDEDCLAGNYPPLVEATSAGDGSFRLPGMRASEATTFTVTAPRHVETQGKWDPAAPARVEVRLGPGGRISGIVRGPSGAFVAGAEVSTWPAESANAPRDTPSISSVDTDAAGRFEIDCVPPVGAWTLHASKDGFADAVHGEATIDAAHMNAACDLALRAIGRIEVLVLDAAGATVTAGSVWYDADGSSGGKDLGADGRCVFEVSRPGEVKITVDAPCAPPCNADAECAAGGTTPLTIRLVAGVVVSGVVVDDRGEPIVGAAVEFGGGGGTRRGWFERKATTDAAGAFRVVGLSSASFKVVVAAPLHESTATKDVAVPGDAMRVVLRRLGRVTMRLRLPADAQAPKRFWITTKRLDSNDPQEGDVHDWTAAVVDVPLAPGRWRVRIDIDGLEHVERECEVVSAVTTPLGEIEFGR